MLSEAAVALDAVHLYSVLNDHLVVCGSVCIADCLVILDQQSQVDTDFSDVERIRTGHRSNTGNAVLQSRSGTFEDVGATGHLRVAKVVRADQEATLAD